MATTTATATNTSSSSSTVSGSKVYQYKLVILGESAVGKSSLVLRFVKNTFSENQESTIGAAFLTQTIKLEGNTLKFEFWDTAGQERYNSIAPMYYRGAHAAIVVYDVTKRESFERAKRWVTELLRNVENDIVISFIGNKIDLDESSSSLREVEFSEAQEYCQEAGGLLFAECSARTGQKVSEAFLEVAKTLPKTEEFLASPRLNISSNRTSSAGFSNRRIDLSNPNLSGNNDNTSTSASSNGCC